MIRRLFSVLSHLQLFCEGALFRIPYVSTERRCGCVILFWNGHRLRMRRDARHALIKSPALSEFSSTSTNKTMLPRLAIPSCGPSPTKTSLWQVTDGCGPLQSRGPRCQFQCCDHVLNFKDVFYITLYLLAIAGRGFKIFHKCSKY